MQQRMYSSFEEIDRDREIYRLEMEIEKRKMTHNVEGIKASISPINIGTSLALSVLKKRFFYKMYKKLLPF